MTTEALPETIDAGRHETSQWRRRVVEFGPALLALLTWLGPGDIIESSVAGGNYGYSLLWVLAVAVGMRFAMVNTIAKFHLCNVHGEGILAGLARIHRIVPLFLGAACALMAHAYCSYMSTGLGELGVAYVGHGSTTSWAAVSVAAALALNVRPRYRRLLIVFRVCLGVLVLTVIGSAVLSRPDPVQILAGFAALNTPSDMGAFSVLLVALSTTGAISGSVSNFIYPHFLSERGWRDSSHRKAQVTDLAIGLGFLLLFNLSLWLVGATQLFPESKTVTQLIELPRLVTPVVGKIGQWLFAVGMAAAVFTSLAGFAHSLAGVADRCWSVWRTGRESEGNGVLYHAIASSALVSSLLWTIPGMPGALRMALIVNCAQIVLVPLLAVCVWILTARAAFIGETAKNRWWENTIMAVLLALSCYAAIGSVKALFF